MTDLIAFLNARLDEAAFDPVVVEALRAVVALHGRMSILPGHPMFNDAHLTRMPMTLCRSCEPETMWRRERSWPCRTLRAIAAIWSDHPDCRPEWSLAA